MAATSNRQQRQAFRALVNSTQAQPVQLTQSQQLILAATAQATPYPLGRLARSIRPAPLYGHRGAGNSAVDVDLRGDITPAQPGKGVGWGPANLSPYPERAVITAPSQLLRRARTPAYQHGRLIARDRRVVAKTGTVMQSGEPDVTKPGIPDPDSDGPARPSYLQQNRTFSFQQGTDSTAQLDNTAAKPATTAGGKPFALGTRGDPETRIYGGTPGLAAYRPYGYRGFPGGTGAPAPLVRALAGGPYRRGTLLEEGSPLDGPQTFPSGPPWGLHTPTVPPLVLTNAVLSKRFRQVKPPRLNRQLNNASAGQSFAQGFVGQDGRRAVSIARSVPGRQPGLSAWRAG